TPSCFARSTSAASRRSPSRRSARSSTRRSRASRPLDACASRRIRNGTPDLPSTGRRATIEPGTDMTWQTHDVFNQFDELSGYDLFATDAALSEGVRRADAGWALPALGRYGAAIGSAER